MQKKENNEYKVKEDCIMYIAKKHECNALNDLYCAKERCKFYKSYKTEKNY